MEIYKKALDLHILSTDNISNIALFDKLLYDKDGFDPHVIDTKHVYLTEINDVKEEDVNDGEFIIYDGVLYQFFYNRDINTNKTHPYRIIPFERSKLSCITLRFGLDDCKKVIATSNKLLNIPLISLSFLKKLCDSNEKISKVFIEYILFNDKDLKEHKDLLKSIYDKETKGYAPISFVKWLSIESNMIQIKTNSRNEVSISKYEEPKYTLEEIKKFCEHAWDDGYYTRKMISIEPNNGWNMRGFDNWFKEIFKK